MSPPDIDSLTLEVFRAQDGDVASFNRVVMVAQPEIAKFAAWYGVPPSDIDDVVQETLVRVHRSINSFIGESRAISWIISIARRVCLDHFRQFQRHRRIQDQIEVQIQPMSHFSNADSLLELSDLIQRLPESLRETFMLVKVSELGYEEVAGILGTPIGTVQSRVLRARLLLSQMIVDAEHDCSEQKLV